LPELPRLDPGGERSRLFEAVASFLGGAARIRPLVVALDDLHEMVRLLVSQGGLRAVGDLGAVSLAVPQRVSEVIEQRLSALSEGCRRVLGVASVLGREFALAPLERVCGDPKEAFLAALDEASAACVIAEVPGARGCLRFAHVLIRDVLYQQLGAARRARLHRQVEEALHALGDDDDDALRVRLLARLAGGPLRGQRLRDLVASLSEQAVDLARRLDDPVPLGYALEARHAAIWAPDNVAERVAMATAIVHLSEVTGDLERLFMGHTYRVWSQLESGELGTLAAEV
jgi:hypothetical protein